MHPVRKQRLLIVTFIVVFATLAVGLLSYALRENINLFFTPSAIVAGEAPANKNMRAGGMVVKGSLRRSTQGLFAEFLITDGAANVTVNYNGILPDLFAEGEAAVVTGQLNDQGIFQATQVLAKHDENYTPPEVADAMEEAHARKQAEKASEANY